MKPLRKICRGNRKRIAQSFPARSARRSKQFCSDAGQEECLNYAVLAGPPRGTLITPRTYSSTQPKWNIVSRRTTLAKRSHSSALLRYRWTRGWSARRIPALRSLRRRPSRATAHDSGRSSIAKSLDIPPSEHDALALSPGADPSYRTRHFCQTLPFAILSEPYGL